MTLNFQAGGRTTKNDCGGNLASPLLQKLWESSLWLSVVLQAPSGWFMGRTCGPVCQESTMCHNFSQHTEHLSSSLFKSMLPVKLSF